MTNLPALVVEVSGKVIASNLNEYREIALQQISSINTDLKTDDDFPVAEENVKWCKEVEDKLSAVKDDAIAQTKSIDELFKTIDEVIEASRLKRLDLSGLIKKRKDEIRNEIVNTATDKAAQHIDVANRDLKIVRLPAIEFDFTKTVKGKRTIDTMQKAVSKELTLVKENVDAIKSKMLANLEIINEQGKDYPMLFTDKQSLVLKDSGDLISIITSRIETQKAHDQAKELLEKQKAQAAQTIPEVVAEAEKSVTTPTKNIGTVAHTLDGTKFEAPQPEAHQPARQMPGIELISVHEFVKTQKEKLDSFLTVYLENQMSQGADQWPSKRSKERWLEELAFLDMAAMI